MHLVYAVVLKLLLSAAHMLLFQNDFSWMQATNGGVNALQFFFQVVFTSLFWNFCIVLKVSLQQLNITVWTKLLVI